MTSKIVVNNIEADAGVSTVTFNSDVERGSSNLHSTGLNVNNTFVHSTGIALGAGSTIGAVTGVTTYFGDGSQLTGISADVVDDTSPQLGGDLDTNTKNIKLGDSASHGASGDDTLIFGADDDMRMYHDGSNAYISNNTGAFVIQDSHAGANAVIIRKGAEVELLHNNVLACETSANGLAFPSGKGIDFSADSSGTLKSLPNSFNAELLHDYENGTFTPNIQYDSGTNRYSGSNVSSAVGEYIRIGDLVNFGMKITLTSNQNHTEGTHIYIGGLPYNGLHSSQQSSMQNGWGGWACPTNDNNFSYEVRYCYHGYTTVNLGFSQSSGNGGISGFYVWGFYRCAP